MSSATLGFAGLGSMGYQMAANLQRFLGSDKAPPELQGSKLKAYNRSRGKAQQLAAESGCEAVGSAAELAGCAVTFVMLANDQAVEAVLLSYLEGRKKAQTEQGSSTQQPSPAGKGSKPIFVDCSTVLPSTTRRLVAQAAEAGVAYLACPVFGRPDAAAAAMLIAVVSGGSDAEREQVKAVAGGAFAGRRVIDLGVEVGAAHACKLAGNFWITTQIEAASEVLALAEKSGVPTDVMVSLLEGMTAAGIPVGYTKRIAAGDYSTETGFAVELALKDVGHMRQLARDSECPLPLADLVFSHLLTQKAKGQGSLDWGAIALSVRDAAGLPPNTKQKHS